MAAFLGVAFPIVLAGGGQIEKYFGPIGVGIYASVALVILAAARQWLIPFFLTGVSSRQAWLLGSCTIVGLAFLFVWVYPLANQGAIGGGSDSDDALNLATRALLRGRYPYAVKTYLGNPATYLPGSFMLAAPFVLLGNAAYQNLFWLAALLVAAGWYLSDIRHGLLLLWTTLLCARVVQALVTGGELLASSIYVVLFVWLAAGAFRDRERPWYRWPAAILLGLGLASRINYLLLLPVIACGTARRIGWSETARFAALTAGTTLVVTVPFWIYDPSTFRRACFDEQNFAAGMLSAAVPHLDVALPLASAVFAVAMAFRKGQEQMGDLLRNCALVQAFPVVALVVLSSVLFRRVDLFFGTYALHFLFFSVLASWHDFSLT